MNLEGKLIEIKPVLSGQGTNGTWQKQQFIFETLGQYPKKVAVTLWGKYVDEIGSQLVVNQNYNSYIEVESREYAGHWYSDVRAWKIEPLGANAKPQSVSPPPTPPTVDFNQQEGGDLPF